MLRSTTNVQDSRHIEYFYLADKDGYFSGAAYRDGQMVYGLKEPLSCYDLFPLSATCSPPLIAPLWGTPTQTKCDYHPRERPWYKAALEARGPAWTVYNAATGGGVAMTASVPVFNGTEVVAVVAVDIKLDAVHGILKLLAGGDEQQGLYLVSTDGLLLSSSLRVEPLMPAKESSEPLIRRASEYVEDHANWEDIDSEAVPRSYYAPLTHLTRLSDCPGCSTVLVSLVASATVLSVGSGSEQISLLVLVAVITALLYTIRESLKELQRVLQDADATSAITKHWERVEEGDSEALEKEMRNQREDVVMACIIKWQRNESAYKQASASGLVRTRDLENTMTLHAVNLIKDANMRRDVLTVCTLERRDGRAGIRVYRTITHPAYVVALQVMLLAHIALSQWLADDVIAQSVNWSLVYLEGAFIAVEVADFTLKLFITYSRRHTWLAQKHLTRLPLNTAILVLLVVITVDWVLTFTVGIRIENYVPIRAILVVLRVRELRNLVQMTVHTLVRANGVFALYLCIIITVSIMGLVLFRDKFPKGLTEDNVDNSYVDILRSLVTTFVYVSTGENYTELVPRAISWHEGYLIYFIVWLLVGMFIVLSMVIGLFQVAFSEMRAIRLGELKMLERRGLLAAFAMMATHEELVPDDSVQGFLTKLYPAHEQSVIEEAVDRMREAPRREEVMTRMGSLKRMSRRGSLHSRSAASIRHLASLLPSSEKRKMIHVTAFILGCEKLAQRPVTKLEPVPKERWRQRLQSLLRRKAFSSLILGLVLGNVWTVALYGIVQDENIIDTVATLFLVCYVVEMALQLLAFRRQFWFSARYRRNGVSPAQARLNMLSDRAELVVIMCAAVARIITAAAGWTGAEMRFVLCIPIVRLLTAIHRTRLLLFTVLQVVRSFMSVCVLLLVVVYSYAIVGVRLFRGQWSLLKNPPSGNFNSLGEGSAVLFQLLVGEAWHEVMYAGIHVLGLKAVWYFASYVTIVTILFSNLFVGIVLDEFHANTEFSTGRLTLVKSEDTVEDD